MADLQLDIPRAESTASGLTPKIDKTLNIPRANNVATGINPQTPLVINIQRAESIATGINPTHDVTLNVPRAISTASGIIPTLWSFPPFYLLDENGNYLKMVTFEDIYPGRKTATKKITLKNTLPGAAVLSVSGGSAFNETDKDRDTKDAIYLSNDNVDFSKSIEISVPSMGSTDFYVYYRPPSTARIGSKTFPLLLDYVSSEFELWDYVTTFPVISNSSENQEDVKIFITINYEADYMQPDFKDIRFYSASFELESKIIYKFDEDYAIFIVKIPLLYTGETKTIRVFGGNSSVNVKEGDVFLDGWNWDNGEMDGWVQTTSENDSKYARVMWDDTWNSYVLRCTLNSVYALTPVIAEADSEIAYGHWIVKYRFIGGYTSFSNPSYLHRSFLKWFFAHDGENNYSVQINNEIGAEWIRLYYNEEILDSAPFPRSLSTHLLEVARDSDGNISVLVDNIEYLTSTDTRITESVKQVIDFYNPSFTRGVLFDYINYIADPAETTPTVGELAEWDDFNYAVVMMGKVSYDIKQLKEFGDNLSYGIRINGKLFK